MKKFFPIGIATLFAVLFAGYGIWALWDSAREDGRDEKQLKVAATFSPLYNIAKNVAGEYANVELLVPPGASPHFYEFSPRQLANLQGTKAIFAIGYGADDWVTKAKEAIPGSEITLVDQGIALLSSLEEHGEEGEARDHGPIDPHYWLSFENARIIADTIARKLGELDSEHEADYRENARVYGQELSLAEHEIKEQLSTLESRNIITLHDAFYYFAQNFDLHIVGTFEPRAGEEPTPQFLARLREEIQTNNIKVLFAEPQMNSESLRQFAKDNNLALSLLDEAGGVEGRDSYIGLMRYNGNAISQALK